jgi:hypothetical protein
VGLFIQLIVWENLLKSQTDIIANKMSGFLNNYYLLRPRNTEYGYRGGNTSAAHMGLNWLQISAGKTKVIMNNVKIIFKPYFLITSIMLLRFFRHQK